MALVKKKLFISKCMNGLAEERLDHIESFIEAVPDDLGAEVGRHSIVLNLAVANLKKKVYLFSKPTNFDFPYPDGGAVLIIEDGDLQACGGGRAVGQDHLDAGDRSGHQVAHYQTKKRLLYPPKKEHKTKLTLVVKKERLAH